jgi:Tfp pilus assembly protein PilO
MVDKKNQTFTDYKMAILFGGGATLVILILFFAVGMPLYKNMQKTSAELKAKKIEQAALETKLENLKKLQEKEADLKSQNEKVLSALPEDKGVSRLFVQFEKIAKDNGLDITSVSESSQGTVTAPAGTLAPVTYVVTGNVRDYKSLKAALSKIETALRVLSVSKVDVSGTGSNLSTTFNVTTYVRGTGK